MAYTINFEVDGFEAYCVVFELRVPRGLSSYSPAQVLGEPGAPVVEVVVDCCLVDEGSRKCLPMPELIEAYRPAIMHEVAKRGLLRWLA